jgi:hypothetical protein
LFSLDFQIKISLNILNVTSKWTNSLAWCKKSRGFYNSNFKTIFWGPLRASQSLNQVEQFIYLQKFLNFSLKPILIQVYKLSNRLYKRFTVILPILSSNRCRTVYNLIQQFQTDQKRLDTVRLRYGYGWVQESKELF